MAQNYSFDDKGHDNGKVNEPPFANVSTTSSNEFGFKEIDKTNDNFGDDMHENNNDTHNEGDGTKVNQINFTITQLTDRVKLIIPLLQKLPELTLEETTLVRNSFANMLGEKEYITNTFELRVLMSELGLYPDEVELELLLRAAKYKLNLPVLCRYMRFYKKEFVTSEFGSVGVSAAFTSGHDHDNPFTFPASHAPITNDASSHSQSSMFRNHVDVETLKAFVALGGNENGSGEIDNTLLKEVVDSFGLTIDVDGVLTSIDTQHSGHLNFDEFCMLWNTNTNSRSMSISSESLNALRSSLRMSFSALNAITPSASSFYLHQLPSHHQPHHHNINNHPLQQSSGSNINSTHKNNINSTTNYPNTSPPLSFGANLNSNNNAAAVNESKNVSMQRGNVLPTLQGNLSLSQGNPFARRASQISAVNSGTNYPNENASRMNTRNTNKFNANISTATNTFSFVKTQTQESQDAMQGKNQGTNLPTSLPISHYEHLQLLYIFLFPEKFEPAAVSGKHARFKEFGIFGSSYNNNNNNTNNNNNSSYMNSNVNKDGMTAAALSRSLRNSTYGRRSMKGCMSASNQQQGNTGFGISGNNKSLTRSGTMNSSMYSNKSKTGDNNLNSNNYEDDNDSDALFITKAGAGVYRPPSPMILSLRNSTAYKKFSKNKPNTLAEVLQSSSVTNANQNKEYNKNTTRNANDVPSYAQTTPARNSHGYQHSKYNSVNKLASETTCN